MYVAAKRTDDPKLVLASSYSIDSTHKLKRQNSKVAHREKSEVNVLAINKMPGDDNQKVILFYTLPGERNMGKAIVMKLDWRSSAVTYSFYWTAPKLPDQVIKINYFLYDARSS